MPVPYNPLDKQSIGDNIIRELAASPCSTLPAPKSRQRGTRGDAFEGAGIYALYYSGDFPAYAPVTAANSEGRCEAPIYIRHYRQ